MVLAYVERPLVPDVRFCLNSMTNANAILDFRFDVDGIKELGYILGLPAVVVTANRNRVHRDEAMCVVLNRLAFPVRFYSMACVFGRSRSNLCDIFWHVINVIYEHWGGLLYLNRKLVEKNVDRYCRAVAAKGSPMNNVFGFIDGTKVPTCRISSTGNGDNLQKQIYSGHKRVHWLNYQAVTAPDGICVHFFGPVEGRLHDTTMLRLSGLIDCFSERPSVYHGKMLYGDPAYGILPYLISGFKGQNVSLNQKLFNKWMSRVRQSVEWNFKLVKSLWAFISYKMLSKIRLSPVAKVVCVSMLLTNCHCCHFGGNQISHYFNLAPPTLREYLDTLEVVEL
jgi:hypothetical protein